MSWQSTFYPSLKSLAGFEWFHGFRASLRTMKSGHLSYVYMIKYLTKELRLRMRPKKEEQALNSPSEALQVIQRGVWWATGWKIMLANGTFNSKTQSKKQTEHCCQQRQVSITFVVKGLILGPQKTQLEVMMQNAIGSCWQLGPKGGLRFIFLLALAVLRLQSWKDLQILLCWKDLQKAPELCRFGAPFRSSPFTNWMTVTLTKSFHLSVH